MKFYILFLFTLILSATYVTDVQAQDKLPVREYTNPDEMITFDRLTPFNRALDVINQFSQKYRGKVIIDRTGTDGPINISIPPMYWKDALRLILNVKGLALIEHKDFDEIVKPPSASPEGNKEKVGGQTGGEVVATTKSREVRINAIFFEGNRRALQEIGVDWSTLTENVPDNVGSFVNGQQGGGGSGGSGGSGGGGGSGGSGGGNGQLPTTSFTGPFVQVNSKGAQSVSQNVFNALVNFGGIGNTGIEVQALFSAFEADNLGEILASPSVKVLDGVEGHIQVGQDFSIKQRDFAGNVTDKFFSVGTILTVTPQIIEQNDTTFIHLTINAERSSAQPDPVSTIINKQQATTEAVLLDGEATVIAGLYRTEQSEVRRGIPILKDLPPWLFGLRYLFGYNSKDNIMRELVILIQAEIAPSIPTRYAHLDNQPSKFEVLKNERNRYREEISRQSERTDELTDHGVETDFKNFHADDKAEKAKMDEPKKAKMPESGNKETKKKEEAKKLKEDNPSKKSVVHDQEIKAEEVPLNFGSKDKKLPENKKEEVKKPAKKEVQKEQAEAKPKNTKPEETESSSNSTYYIVGGSFKSERHAQEFKEKLVKEGYDPQILRNKADTFYFVTYRGYSNLEDAKSDLEKIVQNENKNAWVYRAK